MKFPKISKPTKILLIVLVSIVIISVLFAYIYYHTKNASEDPRVVDTKTMFKEFDKLLAENRFDEALLITYKIEDIFIRIPCYAESFEMGIVYNNRGSVYLSMGLYAKADSVYKNDCLDTAKMLILHSISIYDAWLDHYKSIPEAELITIVKDCFPEGDPAFNGKNYQRIVAKRVDDIKLARNETPRRLSVAYTNLGIIQRHQWHQNEAMESYIIAIKLWKDNFTARNNFNVLMGRPPEDRSIIEQLFPPEKNKFD